MKSKKIKVYTYTRVSTSMQVDGFSLDAQKERIRKYAEAFDYEIVGEYEDAGNRENQFKVVQSLEKCWKI